MGAIWGITPHEPRDFINPERAITGATLVHARTERLSGGPIIAFRSQGLAHHVAEARVSVAIGFLIMMDTLASTTCPDAAQPEHRNPPPHGGESRARRDKHIETLGYAAQCSG